MDINRINKTSLLIQFGAHNAGVIPVLIPNTEVKPSSADYTAMRETRKVPNYAVDFSLKEKSSKRIILKNEPKVNSGSFFVSWFFAAQKRSFRYSSFLVLYLF